ncbi:MAG: oxidoreductase [SAR202 cluster bacterium]|jgi:Fe-S-cluster-containing dehydrogenase component|nr:oxidoreductase [SAR202 cluster bacterium]
MADTEYGLLIDTAWCTGCYSCIIAGRNANALGNDGACITVRSGETVVGDRVRLDFLPEPTNRCNLCGPRTRRGLDPACVHHCPPRVITYGPRSALEELRKSKPGQTLWPLK